MCFYFALMKLQIMNKYRYSPLICFLYSLDSYKRDNIYGDGSESILIDPNERGKEYAW